MDNKLERLLCAIPKGKENALHNEELARQLGVSPTKVKRMIQDAREQGMPIVSSKCGYWITEDREELKVFANSMEKQAKMRFLSIKAIKHTLSGTDGQICLPDVSEHDI